MRGSAKRCTIALVSTYYFDTAEDVERARLEARCALWDPFTFRMRDEVGIGEGWRCLELPTPTPTPARR